MLLHKISNTPYSYGMMLATTAFFFCLFFTGLFIYCAVFNIIIIIFFLSIKSSLMISNDAEDSSLITGISI